MSRRTLVLAALSFVIAAALLAALIMRGGVDGGAILRVLAKTRPERVAVLGLLAAFLAYLSAERWRMIERHTQGAIPGRHAAPSRLRAFGLTAIGVGIGQFLPVQLATALSRAAGARLLKPAASPRPVVVTLYEQSFDVGVALLLGAASGLYLLLRGQAPWWLFAVPALALGYVAAGLVAGHFGWLCGLFVGRGRAGAWMAGLAEADLFSAPLARRLMLVSVLRFAVTALMAGVTSWAAGLAVSLPSVTVALPLVVLATAVPVTPAGLGVNEWTYAGVLGLMGVGAALATQWALINRILVFTVSVVIGALAVLLLAADSWRNRLRPGDASPIAMPPR